MNNAFRKQLERLALEKVDQIIQSLEKDIQMMFGSAIREFFRFFIEDETVFQELYRAYKQNSPSVDLQRQEETISYTHEEHSHHITFLGKNFTLDEEPYAQLLSSTIEILREVLPLGSIVELNPTYFKPDSQSESPSKIVITSRFIAPADYTSYFPYAGVVYPIGEMKPGSIIHFTAPLIKSVIHQGYTDEVEEAYQYLMKQEFIVEKDIRSIEFSGQDMKKLQTEMEQKQKAGES